MNDTRQAGRGADQFPLRLPEGMRESLKAAAAQNGRSMNAEIIERLAAYDTTMETQRSIERHIADAIQQQYAISERLQTIVETVKQEMDRAVQDHRELRSAVGEKSVMEAVRVIEEARTVNHILQHIVRQKLVAGEPELMKELEAAFSTEDSAYRSGSLNSALNWLESQFHTFGSYQRAQGSLIALELRAKKVGETLGALAGTETPK